MIISLQWAKPKEWRKTEEYVNMNEKLCSGACQLKPYRAMCPY